MGGDLTDVQAKRNTLVGVLLHLLPVTRRTVIGKKRYRVTMP